MKKVIQLEGEIKKLRHQVDFLQRENDVLRRKVDALSQRIFGRKSEQLNPAQLQLLFGMLENQSEAPADTNEETQEEPPNQEKPKRKYNQRLRTPENLEVIEEVLIPLEVQEAPEEWREMDRTILEQLDFEPGKFIRRRTIRPRFVHRTQKELPPIIHPAPKRIIDRGGAAPGLLTEIMIGKYADFLPLYRQAEIFHRRYGVWIPRQQMVQWIEQCERSLGLVHEAMRQQILTARYLQVDETPHTYLDKDQPGGSAKGYLWVYLKPREQVVYDWHPSRAADCLKQFLGDQFIGKLQCDGYAAYPCFAKTNEAIELIGCWAHARRKFFEAKDQAPQVVVWILNQIAKLYHWEKQMRESRAGPALRESVRQSCSRLIIQRLEKVLLRFKLKSKYLPATPMGRAIDYALNQWDLLKKVLDHGEVELDNNLVENAIRPTAIGRKNYLFIGHKNAGQRTAVLYSLIQSCRIQGIEPSTYLKDVLERIPYMTNQNIEELTPVNWAAAYRKKELKKAA